MKAVDFGPFLAFDNGQATLVLSGGSSPIDLFERLALIELDWSRVTVLPSDERWVATDQPESNEAALREHLLYGPGNAARLFGLYRDKGTPDDATSQLDAELRQLPRPFDAVVLGMGEDGHTASLFLPLLVFSVRTSSSEILLNYFVAPGW